MFLRSGCIAILACISTATFADSPSDTVSVPLKDIWAWDMSGTKDVRDLEPNNYGPSVKQLPSEEGAKLEKKALAEQIRNAIRDYPWLPTASAGTTKRELGFAVPGSGFEALQHAKRVLSDKKEPSESFSTDQDISVIFFSRGFGDYCHLDHVTRTGNHIEVAWRFVQHGNDWATNHFAIIPLGKLSPGTYDVEMVQLPKPSDWGAKIVCKSFSFTVVLKDTEKLGGAMKIAFTVCIVLMFATMTKGSQDTIGQNGINSVGLMGFFTNQPLTGLGASIGQVDLTRPGKPTTTGGPDDAAHSSSFINPTAVFYQDMPGKSTDTDIDDHAEAIAGIMRSTDSLRTGVATQVNLYAGAFTPITTNSQNDAEVTAANIVAQNGGDVRAINMSFGISVFSGASNDGNQQLSLFVDWSALNNNVLYIVAGHQNTAAAVPDIPKDNFNGMTIASAKKDANGVYDTVGPFNDYSQDADGDRTSISLMAPGDNVQLNTLNGGTTIQSGTSNAAPMVTGTVALLQQYGNQRKNAPFFVPNWSNDYKKPQVMKAVLMNSADKVHLDSDLPPTIAGLPKLPVPNGGFLDQDRTVLRTDNGNWFSDKAAADKTPDTGGLKPLDDQFGAGELDAKRALKQFSAGEFHSSEAGGPSFVPVTGWDFGHSVNQNQVNTYAFNQQLMKGSFISVTLAWDRVVQFAAGGSLNTFHSGDTFQKSTDFQTPGRDQFTDLDLYLIDLTKNNTVEALSTNGNSTIEHIFWQIQNDDNYAIRVLQTNTMAGAVDYGLAWWALGTGPLLSGSDQGDMNQDGHVDAKDIAAMENALANESVYASSIGMTTDELSLYGDVNGDGQFTGADLKSLLDLLKSGNGSTSVPEPSTVLLLASSILFLLPFRHRKHAVV